MAEMTWVMPKFYAKNATKTQALMAAQTIKLRLRLAKKQKKLR